MNHNWQFALNHQSAQHPGYYCLSIYQSSIINQNINHQYAQIINIINHQSATSKIIDLQASRSITCY
jgi:hypothetical protein